MATTGKGATRSDFLRDLFQKNPGVSESEAAQAWAAAGNEGTISPTSFYTAKRESKGGTGDTPAAPEKPKAKSSVSRFQSTVTLCSDMTLVLRFGVTFDPTPDYRRCHPLRLFHPLQSQDRQRGGLDVRHDNGAALVVGVGRYRDTHCALEYCLRR